MSKYDPRKYTSEYSFSEEEIVRDISSLEKYAELFNVDDANFCSLFTSWEKVYLGEIEKYYLNRKFITKKQYNLVFKILDKKQNYQEIVEKNRIWWRNFLNDKKKFQEFAFAKEYLKRGTNFNQLSFSKKRANPFLRMKFYQNTSLIINKNIDKYCLHEIEFEQITNNILINKVKQNLNIENLFNAGELVSIRKSFFKKNEPAITFYSHDTVQHPNYARFRSNGPSTEEILEKFYDKENIFLVLDINALWPNSYAKGNRVYRISPLVRKHSLLFPQTFIYMQERFLKKYKYAKI